MLELIKIAIAVFAYLAAAPVLGWFFGRIAWVRRLCVFLIVCFPTISPYYYNLTIFSHSKYKGHTRGFEVSLIDLAAIIIIVGAWRLHRKHFVWMPPLGKSWLLYCTLASFSLLLLFPSLSGSLVSLEKNGTWVNSFYLFAACFKFFKLFLILLAGHAYVQGEQDLKFLLKCGFAAVVLAVSFALYDRYVIGAHRVRAGFESFNTFGVWSYVWALLLFATVFTEGRRWLHASWAMLGFLAAGVCVILTISRGASAALAIGAVVIFGILFLVQHKVRRRFLMVGVVGLGGLFLVVKSWDQIQDRFVNAIETQNESADLRKNLVKQARLMLNDSFLGVGWNNFPVAASLPQERYVKLRKEFDRNLYGRPLSGPKAYTNEGLVESLYWLVLAETGYPGFIGFMIFVGSAIWISLRNAIHWRASDVGGLCVAWAVTWALFLAHSQLERVFMNFEVVSTLFLLLGVVSRLETSRRRKARLPKYSTRRRRRIGVQV